MDYSLPPELQEGLVVTTNNPPQTLPYLLPHTPAVVQEGAFGSMLTQNLYGDEFSINLHIFQLNDPLRLSLSIIKPNTIFTYVLQGSAFYVLPGIEEAHITEGNYYLFYLPTGSHFLQIETGICMVVQIELTSKLLGKLAWTYYGIHEAHNSMLENASEGLLLNEAWMNPQICDALSKMIYCHLEDELGALYQETRMRDLLLLYTDELADKNKKKPGNFRFSNADINAILNAGNQQIQRIEAPLLLKDIARNSHLHPKKIQAGFRLVYGKSHTELIIETRMKEAKRLLKETDNSVSEIAYEVGYCNASAFIRAFKRCEGITPHQYRQ